jgi:hypothetical protein
MSNQKVETVTIRGLRYVVATIREDDLERIAQKVARIIRDEDKAQAERELRIEHQRMGHTHDGSVPDCLVCQAGRSA